MWINLTREEVAVIREALEHTRSSPEIAAILESLKRQEESAFDPASLGLRMEAFELHHIDGEVEVDDQSDSSALVSIGEGGAYVMAWVWVPYSEEEDLDGILL
jgi:hypothetical protein